MARQFTPDPNLGLDELAAYHQDIVVSLRLYFSPSAPTFAERFVGRPTHAANEELVSRVNETDVRSTFAVLTSLEAHFRIDFNVRCRKRLKDPLSVHFRRVEKTRRGAVRLEEDILEGWKRHTDASPALIGGLRGAFKFRHHIAHGRYWEPKLGRKYDFDYVHFMADGIISGFGLVV
jgi:hypothetical protein